MKSDSIETVNNPNEQAFLTIVILASNEQQSLAETIDGILKKVDSKDIYEIIVFLKAEDCPAASIADEIIRNHAYHVPIRAVVQKANNLHQAFSEIPALIKSTHILIMFADLATSSETVLKMIQQAKEHPNAVVSASKWHKESDMKGYSFFRMAGSRILNSAVAVVLKSKGKDLFSAFRIVPMEIVRRLPFENKSLFGYDYLLRPIALGVQFIEVPTVYRARKEGKTNVYPMTVLKTAAEFFFAALRIRLSLNRRQRKTTKHN